MLTQLPDPEVKPSNNALFLEHFFSLQFIIKPSIMVLAKKKIQHNDFFFLSYSILLISWS